MKDGVVVETEKVEEINKEEVKEKAAEEENALARVDECGSCYGAETEERKCCNTCEDVQTAYREKGWGIQEMDKFEQCKKGKFFVNVKYFFM